MEFIRGPAVNDVEGLNKIGVSTKKVRSPHAPLPVFHNKGIMYQQYNLTPMVSCVQVVDILNRIFNEQIFKYRFVHCDPHPGNVLVRKTPDGKPQVVLLDNGLYREYDYDFSVKYAGLWMAILRSDEAAMQQFSKELGVKEYRLFSSMLTARSWERYVPVWE
jgi:predicted unusual protein kinase regulating ubiquinone biosynthesis (AarF/ABC1/UbiB family)